MRNFLLLLLLGAQLPFGAAQEALSLSRCMAEAERYSPLAAQAPLIESAYRTATAQLRTSYLPQAMVGVQASWQSDVTALPIQLPQVEVPRLSQDQYRATLELNQTLWDGGATAAQRAVQEAQSEAERQRLRADLYAQREFVLQFYFAALLAERQAELLETHVRDLQTRKARAEALVAEGAAIPAQALIFDARLLEIAQQQDDNQARYEAALSGLRLLTGLTIGPTTRLEPPEMPVSISAAVNERPELLWFAAQRAQTKARERFNQTRNLPRINAFGTLGYGRPGLNFLSNDFEPYAIVGLNMRWNIGAIYAGTTQRDRELLRIQGERVGVEEKRFRQSVEIARLREDAELTRLQAAQEKDARIIALREKVSAACAAQLDNGVITPSEYISESTRELEARIGAAIRQTQLMQAQWKLLWILGKS